MAKKPAPARDTTTKTIQQAEAVARDGDIHVNVEVGGFTGSVVRRQAMFWTCTAAIFLLFLVIFSPFLLPFVAGLALAYFLDPVADRLERLGLSRLAATIVILLVFLMILVVGLMIIIPVLATQLADFISKLPDYISQLQALLANENSSWLKRYIGIDSSVIQENLSTLLQQGAGFLSTLLQSLWNSGKSLIDIAGLFIVTPVVAFYMLLDWDRMVDRIDSWVPRRQLYTVRGIARDMDAAVAGFVRGQGTLCLILGTYYAIGLTLTGLNFGLLIGFFCGAYQLHSLYWLLRWSDACNRCCAGSVLAGLDHDCGCCRRIFPGPVCRRKHPPAKARRIVRGPASGLADVRSVRFRFSVWLHWNAGCSTSCGSGRGACALCPESLSPFSDV